MIDDFIKLFTGLKENFGQIKLHAKVEFDKRVNEAKKQAIEENKKIALKSGNKLTQNVDNKGNLIGVANMNTTESSLSSSQEVSSADIRKELFEGVNIRTRDTDKMLKKNMEKKEEDEDKKNKDSEEEQNQKVNMEISEKND